METVMSDTTGDALALPNEALQHEALSNEPLPTQTSAEQTPDVSLPARALNGQLLPGHSGNPRGRPIGARSKAKLAVEQRLSEKAEALSDKMIALALEGNLAAMKLCIERLAPRPRASNTEFALPAMNTAADVRAAQDSLIEAIAGGEIEHDQVKSLTMMLELRRKSIHDEEIAQQAKSMAANWMAAVRQDDGHA
jgi:Family of unknown function (DUF5681)